MSIAKAAITHMTRDGIDKQMLRNIERILVALALIMLSGLISGINCEEDGYLCLLAGSCPPWPPEPTGQNNILDKGDNFEMACFPPAEWMLSKNGYEHVDFSGANDYIFQIQEMVVNDSMINDAVLSELFKSNLAQIATLSSLIESQQNTILQNIVQRAYSKKLGLNDGITQGGFQPISLSDSKNASYMQHNTHKNVDNTKINCPNLPSAITQHDLKDVVLDTTSFGCSGLIKLFDSIKVKHSETIVTLDP